jgi:hypothetical protein
MSLKKKWITSEVTVSMIWKKGNRRGNCDKSFSRGRSKKVNGRPSLDLERGLRYFRRKGRSPALARDPFPTGSFFATPWLGLFELSLTRILMCYWIN